MLGKEEKDVVDTTEHGEDSGNETGWKCDPVGLFFRIFLLMASCAGDRLDPGCASSSRDFHR